MIRLSAAIAALALSSWLWAANTAQAWTLGFLCALAVVGLWQRRKELIG